MTGAGCVGLRTDESCTVPAPPVFRWRFEGEFVFDVHDIVVVAAGDFADDLERLRRIHPAERDTFDLKKLPGRLWFLPEGSGSFRKTAYSWAPSGPVESFRNK